MQSDLFERYISEINKAYSRGDATEHTHRPALKELVQNIAKKVTATNEPKRIDCGAPDFIISQRHKGIDRTIGYIECKDIGTDLRQAAKTEQIKKRYLPSLHNFILTDYIEFWWYVDGEKRLTAKLADEKKEKFSITEQGQKDLAELFDCFFAQEPQRITTAKDLATKMAHKAQMMREVIAKTFEQEGEIGTLHGQYEGFKEVLLHDLSEIEFADMYAQTISYGLFTARCHIDETTLYGQDKHAVFHGMNGKTGEFTREHAAFMLPRTNPFLRSVFGHIAGADLDDRVAWLVDDLVELLRQADMGQVLRDFAKKKGRRDPVVHFYETFLSEYDPKARKKRGVYYTPDEVVSYIVRSVDFLLKEKFGLKRGLADESKVKIDGKETHKVLILDPAVGTGTFLFEVIDQIYRRFMKQKGMWSAYVREHLLPRLFGFEIQMAPYAVCHMKLGLELANTGYDFESDERLGIYLTNTLEEAEEISKNVFVQWLSQEAREANKVKTELPIMVVVGNPPYSVSSQNKGPYIDGLMELYKKSVREDRNIQPLSDDYVKFIRFAHERIEQSGIGIIGLITNHSFLSGLVHRGMREELLNTFDQIFVLDLHGNAMRGLTAPDGSVDNNVFDIRQGVSISIFVRQNNERNKFGQISYAECWGQRSAKCRYLSENSVDTTEWIRLKPMSPYFFFVPKKFDLQDEYMKGKQAGEIFVHSGTCTGTGRDKALVSHECERLENLIDDLRNADFTDKMITEAYDIKDTSGWNFFDRRHVLSNEENLKDRIIKYQYRVFDIRWIFYHPIIRRDSRRIMRHMRQDNLGLILSQQQAVKGFRHAYVTRLVVDESVLSTSTRERAYVYPLYVYPEEAEQIDMDYDNWPRDKEGRIPNLSHEVVEDLVKLTKLKFVSDGRGDLGKTFGPEDVFCYIYGILHSPEYRKRYAEFLKIDFPRIPWPSNKKMFRDICEAGGELVKLHLMETEILEDEKQLPLFGIEGSCEVEKGYPKYVAHSDNPERGKVYINKNQYFEGVAPYVWEFYIGGYQVCDKWLKDRRERKLSYDDVKHYQKVVVALRETIRLMKQIDEVIVAQGGWPIK